MKNRDFEACAVVVLNRKRVKWHTRDGWGMDRVLARGDMCAKVAGRKEDMGLLQRNEGRFTRNGDENGKEKKHKKNGETHWRVSPL